MTEFVKRSATWMAMAVRSREVAAVELLDAHVERIAHRNPEVNALVLPRLDEARREARTIDDALARGDAVGPLAGVPFTVKDSIPVGGMPWPNGSKLFADRVASEDAEAVRRLRSAGGILLGKTNVPEFAAWWDSVNLVFGATANPHDTSRTAGGSSGGEAAALASGMSALGLGSDLASSIRNPSHFCGVFGLKPGRDVVPIADHGSFPLAPGFRAMAVVGPMARTVDDLELALGVLAPGYSARASDVRSVAVYEEDGLQPVSSDCRTAVRAAAGALESAGFAVVDAAPPNAAEVRAAFDTVVDTESVPAFRTLVSGREDELSPYLQAMLEGSRDFEPSWDSYFDASALLARLELEADAWFARHGIALCPVAIEVAPPLGGSWSREIDGVPTRPGGKLTLATYTSALGLPAVAVPALRGESGLPVGVQLSGGRGSERDLLAVARVLEQALGGWLDPDER